MDLLQFISDACNSLVATTAPSVTALGIHIGVDPNFETTS
jgi:hypothetical protein